MELGATKLRAKFPTPVCRTIEHGHRETRKTDSLQ